MNEHVARKMHYTQCRRGCVFKKILRTGRPFPKRKGGKKRKAWITETRTPGRLEVGDCVGSHRREF